jgi:hypothetical protein
MPPEPPTRPPRYRCVPSYSFSALLFPFCPLILFLRHQPPFSRVSISSLFIFFHAIVFVIFFSFLSFFVLCLSCVVFCLRWFWFSNFFFFFCFFPFLQERTKLASSLLLSALCVPVRATSKTVTEVLAPVFPTSLSLHSPAMLLFFLLSRNRKLQI